ncbi:MAG TPA: hypothetical protein VE778_02220 [Candidatus Bathyarchaeia archaeon]|jgi:hypothetical protein|nr:hypothetical protein [Candidatus Bathyarchaeia archaeon]
MTGPRERMSIRQFRPFANKFCFFAVILASFVFFCLPADGQTPPAEPPAGPAAVPASAQPPSPEMAAFQRARGLVEKFFEQATNVVCTENVSQAVVGKNGKVDYREDSVFDYQLQANPNSGSLKLVESRDTRKAAFRDSSRTLLITNGFTAMLLIMHPSYQSSYTFDPAGQESVDGVSYDKINFKAVPGAASPAALQLRGHNYPLPLSGTIWIEPQSGAVVKLVSSLDASLSDLGLQGIRSEIHYALIRFHEPEESYWMPISAIIDVETPRQHWRNVHRFTGYKRFRATIRVEDLETKP